MGFVGVDSRELVEGEWVRVTQRHDGVERFRVGPVMFSGETFFQVGKEDPTTYSHDIEHYAGLEQTVERVEGTD